MFATSDPRERLFFALWPDEAVRRRIAAEQARVNRARRSTPGNLHLTLAFLGDCDRGARHAAERAGDSVAGEPFQIVLSRLGSWRRSGVAWLAPEETAPALAALVERLHTRLAEGGFERKRRAFRPHVTLARRAPPQRPASVPPIVWPVAAFHLVASRRGPDGSFYERLREWPLK